MKGKSVQEGRGRAPIARAGNKFTVMLPEKSQIVTQSNLFTTMLKLYLFTVGKYMKKLAGIYINRYFAKDYCNIRPLKLSHDQEIYD